MNLHVATRARTNPAKRLFEHMSLLWQLTLSGGHRRLYSTWIEEIERGVLNPRCVDCDCTVDGAPSWPFRSKKWWGAVFANVQNEKRGLCCAEICGLWSFFGCVLRRLWGSVWVRVWWWCGFRFEEVSSFGDLLMFNVCLAFLIDWCLGILKR